MREINKDVKDHQWQEWDVYKNNMDRHKEIQALYLDKMNAQKV